MFLFIPLVAIFIFFNLVVSLDTTSDGTLAVAQAEENVVGDSMLALHTFASAYAQANPSFTGTALDSTIGSPTWYNRPASVATYITGGQAYVYYTGPAQGLPAYLIAATKNVAGAGTNQGGVLISPGSITGTAGIPSQVPNNAVVLMP